MILLKKLRLSGNQMCIVSENIKTKEYNKNISMKKGAHVDAAIVILPDNVFVSVI